MKTKNIIATGLALATLAAAGSVRAAIDRPTATLDKTKHLPPAAP